MVNLVNTSITANTWAVYNSGWNNFKAFELYEGKSIPLPLDIKTFRAYVTWSLTVKKLKVSTVKLYISSLKLAHAIQGYDTDNIFRDKLSELILAGAENTEPLNVCSRRAMTIDILMILGHKIALTDWSKLSKQVVWAACTTSFFCSTRLGEILAAKSKAFDRGSTLTWKNVLFLDKEEILLFVPSTKTSGKGEFIDMYPIKDHPCCPVAALKKLKNLVESKSTEEVPVFTFSSGQYLTVDKLNNILKSLLTDVCENGLDSITAHSFRAGIPSAISACPDRFYTAELKEWSRWKGSSFLLYCRSYRDQRRKLFEKILKIL
jgi:hypothetical protein